MEVKIPLSSHCKSCILCLFLCEATREARAYLSVDGEKGSNSQHYKGDWLVGKSLFRDDEPEPYLQRLAQAEPHEAAKQNGMRQILSLFCCYGCS